MNGSIDLDKVFCMMSKKYRLEKLLVKAVAMVESSLNTQAYRYEPLYWQNYLSKDPRWEGLDPKEVSASYGLMQLMYSTAYDMGFRGPGVELYDPVVNVELGCRLLSELLRGIRTSPNLNLFPIEIALARYNGGFVGNPSPDGKLRNYDYVKRVKAAYWALRARESNCDEGQEG